MKLRRFFGLFPHHANIALMHAQIRSGDTILYYDRTFHTKRLATVECVVGGLCEWVFIRGDVAVDWNDILEWIPSHPRRLPTGVRFVDMSGDDYMAMAFVKQVMEELQRGDIVILYEKTSEFSPPSAGIHNPKIWPRMSSATFRQLVMQALPKGKFSPPDTLDDGWSYAHYPPQSLASTQD